MASFKATILLDNAAFQDGGVYELAALLRGVADNVEAGDRHRTVFDPNGNTVGWFEIVGRLGGVR